MSQIQFSQVIIGFCLLVNEFYQEPVKRWMVTPDKDLQAVMPAFHVVVCFGKVFQHSFILVPKLWFVSRWYSNSSALSTFPPDVVDLENISLVYTLKKLNMLIEFYFKVLYDGRKFPGNNSLQQVKCSANSIDWHKSE